MKFDDLIQKLIYDTTGVSLGHFVPELVLCFTIVALLLARIAGRSVPSSWLALLGSLTSFLLVVLVQFPEANQANAGGPSYFFTGLLVYDQFTIFFRLFLLLFLILVLTLTMLSGIPDDEDGPDFYTLLLGSTLGLMLMVSANHLLILFLGIEMASVPSYVLVGFLKGRRPSSEASLKYVVYGAGAAGVMLYGISLLSGLLGTADMRLIAERVEAIIAGGSVLSDPSGRAVILATLLVMVGLAFKLSLVPFHFWCPDAFEGASAEVGGFLSVASKAAAFALLVRFCISFVSVDSNALSDLQLTLGIVLGLVAALSTTFGNLAAYAQTNMKRLLAYSTIAHAGYMLMAVAAMMVILSGNKTSGLNTPNEATRCVEGLLYYLCVYMFMNLGAFAIVALIRNQIFSEEIKDYNGLWTQMPGLCVLMAICLFSLVGLPPFGGFFAKMMIFRSLLVAGEVHRIMWAILAIGGLNTVFSLFYYLRVLNALFVAPRPKDARTADLPLLSTPGFYVLTIALPVLLLGFAPYLVPGLSQTAYNAASALFFR